MFDLNSYPFLQISFLGNTIADWAIALVIFFVVLLVLKLFKNIIVAKLKSLAKKSKTEIDDLVIDAIKAIHWPFYVLIAIYVSLQSLHISSAIDKWAFYILLIAIVYYAIRFFERLIDFGAKIIIKKQEEGEENTGIIKLISTVAKIILWAGAIVLILSNLGYNVTSLVAGLGIGGLAIALAIQNILGDLFSSLSIYFDKPFKIGDFIVVGDQMGTVKKVGIKTTRIQLLQGEELVVANSEITKSQLRNFGVMERRRLVLNIGVTYDTPAEKLEKIPGYIEEIIKGEENTEVDRIHFKSFGDSALI